MMIDFIKRFGKKNSILIGTVHNNINYTHFVDNLTKKETFDFFLIELNMQNLNFIKRNDVYFSEFYPVIKNVEQSKIALIDASNEIMLDKYNEITMKKDFFNSYISFKYNRYYYHLMRNIIRNEQKQEIRDLLSNFYENHHFHNVFIKFRESLMLERILSFSNYKVCVIVGRNHFHQIFVHLSNLNNNNM